MTLLDLSAIFLGGFALLAFLDGIVFHLWKYRLYAFQGTFYEHLLHSLRAILFPIIVLGLYAYDTRGVIFYVFFTLAIIDLIIQGFDMWEEKNARTRFGGLSSSEYLLHGVLTSLHTSAILLYVLGKPAQAWTSNTSEILNSSPISEFIAINLIPGAVIIAGLHVVLLLPYFRKNEQNVWKPSYLDHVCCFPARES